MATKSAWTFADAWVMTGVAMSGDEGCDLAGLIAAADACNHAILTAGELAQGVGRLMASGLLTHDGVQLRLTNEGKRVVDQRKGSMFSQINSVQRQLAGTVMTEGRWSVTPEEVHEAYKTYIKRLPTQE